MTGFADHLWIQHLDKSVETPGNVTGPKALGGTPRLVWVMDRPSRSHANFRGSQSMPSQALIPPGDR
jgi:hypothetical protein